MCHSLGVNPVCTGGDIILLLSNAHFFSCAELCPGHSGFYHRARGEVLVSSVPFFVLLQNVPQSLKFLPPYKRARYVLLLLLLLSNVCTYLFSCAKMCPTQHPLACEITGRSTVSHQPAHTQVTLFDREPTQQQAVPRIIVSHLWFRVIYSCFQSALTDRCFQVSYISISTHHASLQFQSKISVYRGYYFPFHVFFFFKRFFSPTI